MRDKKQISNPKEISVPPPRFQGQIRGQMVPWVRLGHLQVGNVIDKHCIALEPTSYSLNLHYKPTFASLICVKSCLVEGRDKYRAQTSDLFLSQQHEVCFLTTKSNCPTRDLRPHHQPKQMTWNLTNHRRRHSTANRINHCSSLIQSALLRANLRNSSEITFGLFTTHLPARYQETTTQQTAPTADQHQLNPAAVPTQPSNGI